MKRVLLIQFSVFAWMVSLASAQANGFTGAIDVSSSQDHWDCNLPNSGAFSIYAVMHPYPTSQGGGFFAVDFSMDLGPIFDAGGWIIAENHFGVVISGTSVTDWVQVGFGSCQYWGDPLYEVQVFVPAAIVGKEYISIGPGWNEPNDPLVAAAGCGPLRYLESLHAGQGVINGDCTVRTGSSTWGQIKALYGQGRD